MIEDYAHHPAEIRALLPSLRRRLNPGGRLIAVFQPHRYSRTARFKAEFAASLALADSVHLLDVYSAGEAPVSGGTTADVYSELKRGAPLLPVGYLPGNASGCIAALLGDAKPGDVIAFVGAGDIDRIAREWISAVKSSMARNRPVGRTRGSPAPPFCPAAPSSPGRSPLPRRPLCEWAGRRGYSANRRVKTTCECASPGDQEGRGARFHPGSGLQLDHSRRGGRRVGGFPFPTNLGPPSKFFQTEG